MPDQDGSGEAFAPRVAIRTLGCKVNQVESEQISASLLAAGFKLTRDEDADVVVVNTCTVTADADTKARKLIRRELRRPGEPLVVVTGCLAAVDSEALEALGERVITAADKASVARRVAESQGIALRSARPGNRAGEGFHTRAMVKIQDGCDSFCTYCIVPAARGLPRSVALPDVLAEVEGLLDAGVREIVLTGVNLGRYESSGTRLADLIAAVGEIGPQRIRLSSIEPLDLTDDLLDTLADTPAIAPHLHVPLQSGSDRVLRMMGRRYSVAEYAQRLEAARDALPGLAVTTDVIAGFPGERDEDARETLACCDALGFCRLHVFRFSARATTPAASQAEQVPPDVRARRAAELRALDRALRERFARSRVGGNADVLVEQVAPGAEPSISPAPALGTSGDYLKVRIAGVRPAVGDLVAVRLAGLDPDGTLTGVPEGRPAGIQW